MSLERYKEIAEKRRKYNWTYNELYRLYWTERKNSGRNFKRAKGRWSEIEKKIRDFG